MLGEQPLDLTGTADPAAWVANTTEAPSPPAREQLTMDLLGWDAPIALAAVLVAGAFALVNSWIGESLKRMWARGDRIRLLRSEYLHIVSHYAQTLEIWENWQNVNSIMLRQAKYDQDGFLSENVPGLAPLYPELLRGALHLKGLIRNTNHLLETKAAELNSDRDLLGDWDMHELTDRLAHTANEVSGAYERLPPEWASISLWRRAVLLKRGVSAMLGNVPRGDASSG